MIKKPNRYCVIGDICIIDVSTPEAHPNTFAVVDKNQREHVLDGSKRWRADGPSSVVRGTGADEVLHRHLLRDPNATVRHIDLTVTWEWSPPGAPDGTMVNSPPVLLDYRISNLQRVASA